MEKKIDLAARHYILLEEGSGNKKVPFCMRLVGLDGDDRAKQQQVRRRIEKILTEGKEMSIKADFPLLTANIPNNTQTVNSPLSLSSNSSIAFSTSAPTKKAFNLSSSQVQKQQKQELIVKKNKQSAHKEATALYYQETLKKNGLSSEKIVANINGKYNTHLAASTIRRYVQNGKIAVSPTRAGPKGLICDEVFQALCGAYRTFVQLVQAEGVKEKPRKELQALVNAVINKKEGQGARRNDKLLKRVIKETADFLVCGSLQNIEARRNKSTTYQSLNQWFDFMSEFFLSMGFAERQDEAVQGAMEGTSEEGELLFYPGQKNRICNFDEVGLSLNGGSLKGGRPSVTFFDPEMPRPGSSTNKSNFSFTMLIGSNAAGEIFPPHFQFPTASKSDDQQWSPEILTGMHQICGKFGHEEEKYFSPTFGANEKGGMDAIEFEKFQLTTMHHYFPDARDRDGHRVCQQLDSGPGRMNQTMLPRLRLQGIRITLKLPNSTHVSQEMDQLYAFFKSIFDGNLEVLTEYQLRKHGKTSIGRFHVGQLIFGGKVNESDEDSPILRNCYMEAFSKEHVLRAWAKVGVVPMTRACLNDPKVRHEITINGDGQLEDSDPLAKKYAALERENAEYVAILEKNGYDGDLLSKTLPRKNMEQRRQALTMPHTKERQEILAKAKTAGAIFLATGGIDICGDDMLNSFGLKDAEHALNEMTNRRKQALAANDREQKALATIEEREGKSYRVKDLEILIRWKLGTGIPGSIKGLKGLKEKWDELAGQPAASCEKWTDEDEERYLELQTGTTSSQNTDYGRLKAVRQHELMNSVDTMSEDQLEILRNRLDEMKIGSCNQTQEP